MHRRSVSSSATEGSPQLHVLVQKRASVLAAMAGSSRFKAEAETDCVDAAASAGAPVSLSRLTKRTSDEDHIVCQSQLYDAFELQGLEHHLDRELDFDDNRRVRTISSVISGQESQKPLLSVSKLGNDYQFPADSRRERASCTCNFCKSDVKSSLLRSLIDHDYNLPGCKESLTTVSDIRMEPATSRNAEASCSGNSPRAAYMNDPKHNHDLIHDDDLARRSLSMPRWYFHGAPGGATNRLAAQDQEALQDRQVQHTDQYPVSSTAKVVKAHQRRRAKSNRWPLVHSLFRFLTSTCKKQINMCIMEEDATSPLTAMNGSTQQWIKEIHHHHNVVHYHHVYHHHHHHVVNGKGHVEEIDWPLSPARLQELGWIMSRSYPKAEDL